MKIWGNVPKVSGVYSNTNKIEKSSKISEVASKKDELTISGTAKDFNVVMKALKQIPDIRQDKVDEISRKIERGEYSVSASDVAERIIGAINTKTI